MSYLKQAQEAYIRLQAGQGVAAADQTAEATQREISELSERSPLAATPLPPTHDAEEHAGGLNGVTVPPCWACHNAVYWIRRKEVGGGVVCATCHPPHPAVQQEAAP